MTLRLKIAIFGGILMSTGYVGYQWLHRADESPPPLIHPRVSQSKFTVKGMTYANSYKGKPLIVMKVNSVEFGKKKIGFFRVGGVRQLELRGAEIDYHEPFEEGSGDFGLTDDPWDISSVVQTAAGSFTNRKGRLAGLQIHRVRLHYHHADGTQTDIEGNLLEIHRSDKSLRIRGNVHVRHAGRSLRTDEIYFQPQDKTFFTKHNYTLTTNGKIQKGSKIRADLFLNQLPGQTMKEKTDEASRNLSKGG
jgi:hypothetical protein